MNIKRNIIFSLESRKKNSIPIVDNVPIRMRVTYTRHRIEFTTGYRIDASKWDDQKQRVRNGCSNKLKQTAADINANLNDYYTAIQTIFKEFEVRDVIPTPEQLKQALNARNSSGNAEPQRTAFMTAFDEFVKEEGSLNDWTNSTYIKFQTIRNHFEEFNTSLSFDYFDESGLTEFISYLRDAKGMRNSTALKNLSFLKWFLRWAFRKGYSDNRAFDGFKPKLKTTAKKVIFLTWNELTRLREYEIPTTKQYLERVRDVFLFTCFTGLRYSDAYNLKRSDIKGDRIEVTTIKTADSLTIELNDHSWTILNKYKDVHFEDDKALPVICNQKMNAYLKELADICGIKKLLTTHVARHTFATFTLANGVSIENVAKMLGHSDIAMTRHYARVLDKTIMKEMQNIQSFGIKAG